MSQELSVVRGGDPAGPPLVLLHGITDAATSWPDALEHWGGDYAITSLDQRGHGHAPRFEPGEWARELDIWTDDLLALLAQVGPARVAGHSLGGRVALLAALRRPDLVTALLLEDPALSPQGDGGPGFIEGNLAALRAFDADGGARARAEQRASTPRSDAEIDAWARSKPLVDRAMIEHLDLGRVDGAAALEAVAVPTLVVTPVGSTLVPPAGSLTNPLVRFVTVPAAGHCVRRDNPTGFYAAADPFLAAAGHTATGA
jgi:pimeloyl-ACP methyl ester carboxylesterase